MMSLVSAIRIGDWKYLWRVTGDDTWQKPPEERNPEDKRPNLSTQSTIIAQSNQLLNLADPLEEMRAE